MAATISWCSTFELITHWHYNTVSTREHLIMRAKLSNWNIWLKLHKLHFGLEICHLNSNNWETQLEITLQWTFVNTHSWGIFSTFKFCRWCVVSWEDQGPWGWPHNRRDNSDPGDGAGPDFTEQHSQDQQLVDRKLNPRHHS